ncbi:MAG: ATP-binding protein [Bacteroidota bacterium]
MVLKATEFLIPEDSFQNITPKEVAILIFAIVLHDIGMHTEFATFIAMIGGKYDDVKVDVLDKKSWAELWVDYLSESSHWSSIKLEEIFGKPNEIFQIPDLSDKDKLTGTDKKLIGEFIRRNHARLAHEIALKGFVGNHIIPFGNSEFDERDKQLAGIIARSHGINIRDTFSYLKEIAQDAWQYPDGVNIVFLMVLLRIADYLQIDKTRTNEVLLKLKTLNSPVSLREHKTHLSIRHIHFGKLKEPELIYIECDRPEDARMYVKIQTLIKDIQHELDLSWAVLGEVIGFNPENKPKFKFRRVDSNLGQLKLDYVPQKISFEVNNELSKLLVAPLYGDNPTYGVRELVQNATDACKERIKIEQDKGNTNYEPLVTVSIDKIDEEKCLFKIRDNGKGMTLDEILNYFLSVGSSFRKTVEWKKEFTVNGKSLVNRNGKFGIGVLATFLLGDEISVKTKSIKDNSKAFVFTANMNSDFIDIKTIDDFEFGTEIEIQLSENILDRLIKPDYFNKITWTDWYISENPKIQYLLFSDTIKPNTFFKPIKEREIRPKDYDKIQWDYSREIKGSYDMFVACNDIIVTLENSRSFAYNYSDVIKNRPNIIISDSQGNLPLSLNRNRLESWILPFEEVLYRDVCLDLIARILMLSISSETINKYSLFPHNTDFIFLANGFSLDVDYFIKKITNCTLIRILTRDSEKILDTSIFNTIPNLIIYPQFYQLNGLRGKGEKVVPNIKAHILLKKQRYEEYFEEERRIPQWLKNQHKVQWKNDKYIAYTMNDFQSQLSLLTEEEFSEISDKLDSNIQSIQEIPLPYLPVKKGGVILNQLFEKFIGDNVVIPYDLEERKKLYPLAFDELQYYMNDYKKE